MKKLLYLLVLLCCVAPLHATTYYATSSSTNINAASLWVPTQGASCAGSGTALTWGNQLNGDVFDSNGCTSLAVNVDPGSVSVHVTLKNDATNTGGGFTYATATNITIHADITNATTTATLTVTGSTGGLTIVGNLQGGAATAVTTAHTSVTLTVTGNITGGTGSGTYGLGSTSSGPIAVTGNVTSGSGASTGHGLFTSSTGAITVTGNCIGSDTVESAGCRATSTGTITIIGNIINGKRGNGAQGTIIFTPAATNYVLYAKDASYVLNTINTHSTEMPSDPTIGNVKSGTAYGSFTGTLSTTPIYGAAGGGWK